MKVFPPQETALASIEFHARLKPDFPAVLEPVKEPGKSAFTYSQFWQEIDALSTHLRQSGLQSHQVVVVLVQPGALAVLAVAAVMRHCCCAPLNPNLTASEIESHLVAMHAAAIVLTPEFEAARQIALRLGITVLLGHMGDAGAVWNIEKTADTTSANHFLPDLISGAAVLLNTSATTGRSKLVPLTGGNLEAMFRYTQTALALSASDRLLLVTPLYHAQGIVSTFAQLSVGGTIIATRGFEAASYPGWLQDLHPTWYTCAPAIHQAVVTVLENRPLKKPVSLRFVRSSGAAFTVKLARDLGRLLGVPVLNGYGMSETGAITSDALNLRPYRPGSVGRSVGPTIAIMDPSGKFLLPEAEGEIVVRGPSVMAAYANDPEANEAAFRDGWFRTGDIGRLDAAGFLFVTGRSKEMINRGGQKIVPEDVDRVFAAHPAVLAAAAFAVPHPTLGEDIACAIVPRPDSSTSEAELRRFASQKLAPFKVPRRVYFVDQIPRGETGKPRRHLLAERITQKPAASGISGTPSKTGLANNVINLIASPSAKSELSLPDLANDPTFRRLIEIWARVLKRDEIDQTEDFFTAGGDSLGAVNLLAEIDLRFGSDLQAEAASFLDNPTLANIATLLSNSVCSLSAASASSEVEVFPVREEPGRSPIFCIPGDGDEGLYFRRLASHLAGQLPLSIVRPVNTWHDSSLFTFERAAEKTIRAIQQVQPDGPYILGGYCYGGIVAFAAAHLLRKQGHAVKLVLFDVPSPGFPTMFRGFGTFAQRAVSEGRQFRRKNGAANPAVNFRRLIRRAMWFSIRPARRMLDRVNQPPALQWMLKQSQQGYLPLYHLKKLDVPILHFLSIEEHRPIRGNSRFGWRHVARRGITEQWISLDHDRLFQESNLSPISRAIAQWCGVSVEPSPLEELIKEPIEEPAQHQLA
ncbi:AMP-binding protein [Acidicapsa acidisoli]|uniref:AMP-binding protein n=1 Tax=Acidicapsa acidisoli TaxID=1615681 RepID=UPI0021E06AE5|nr:AMP-binding protein [Acidicapsa acidisoli]